MRRKGKWRAAKTGAVRIRPLPLPSLQTNMPKARATFVGTVLRKRPCKSCIRADEPCHKGPGKACARCYSKNKRCKKPPQPRAESPEGPAQVRGPDIPRDTDDTFVGPRGWRNNERVRRNLIFIEAETVGKWNRLANLVMREPKQQELFILLTREYERVVEGKSDVVRMR